MPLIVPSPPFSVAVYTDLCPVRYAICCNSPYRLLLRHTPHYIGDQKPHHRSRRYACVRRLSPHLLGIASRCAALHSCCLLVTVYPVVFFSVFCVHLDKIRCNVRKAGDVHLPRRVVYWCYGILYAVVRCRQRNRYVTILLPFVHRHCTAVFLLFIFSCKCGSATCTGCSIYDLALRTFYHLPSTV